MFKHRLAKGPLGLFFYALPPARRPATPFQAPAPHAVSRRLPRQPAPARARAHSRTVRAAAVAAWLFTASLVPSQAPAQARLLPTASLAIGTATAHVEIAATPETRNHGLMFRASLPADHGMLFVFEQETTQCFWMKNTPLPLTIAFIDAQGRIVNMRDMQPFSEATHCPARPMRYALEMRQGWFQQYGIQAGQTVQGLP